MSISLLDPWMLNVECWMLEIFSSNWNLVILSANGLWFGVPGEMMPEKPDSI
jgi:hypothetical protein